MSFDTDVKLDLRQILIESATKTHELGTRGQMEGGRVFRYAKAGATALVPYRLVSGPAETPFSTATDIAFYSAYAAGSTYVKIGGQATDTQSATADSYADGWLLVFSTDTAYCQFASIHSHSALASSTALGSANDVWLKFPGLQKTVATDTSMVKLIRNPYGGVIVQAGGPASVGAPRYPMGVPQFAVTAGYYFWLQTWGTTLIRGQGGGEETTADKAGVLAILSTGDTGGFSAPSTGLAWDDTSSGHFAQTHLAPIGIIMTANPADNFYTLVNLTLAP